MPNSVIEANKRLATAFCEAFSQGDWARIEDLCADDFRWRAPTSQRRQSAALQQAPLLNADPGWSRSEMLTIFRDTKERCDDGIFSLTPVTITAEEDRVCVEAVGNAVSALNGRMYDNRYHHLFVCRSGKLAELREYQDTLHLFDVWIAP
jgi:hypothetical protein